MKMPFGKYKGTEVYTLEDEDPSYIIWLNDNCDLHGELELCVKEMYPRCKKKYIPRKTKTWDGHEEKEYNSFIPVEDNSKYNCGWGCERYNSCCDACDEYIASDSAWETKKESKQRFERAKAGLNPNSPSIWGESDEGDSYDYTMDWDDPGHDVGW